MKKQSADNGKKGALSFPKAVGLSCLCGIAAAAAVLLAGSAVFSGRDISRSAMLPFALAAILAAGFSSGFVCGRIMRKNGMLFGLCCGVILFIMVSVLECILIDGDISVLALYKLALYTVSAMIGGVSGVNKRTRSKKPRIRQK